MTFTSAFCFVLVLSYTTASKSTESKSKVRELLDKISTAVVGELIQVVKAAKGNDTVGLDKKLLETTRNVLKWMELEFKELFTLSGDSVQQVSKDLAHKINHNKALRRELPKDVKIKSRAIAQMVVGGWGGRGVAMQAISG